MQIELKIQELRKARRMSQTQLAKQFSMQKQNISNWECKNVLPSAEMLVKIADYFSVSTDYLLGIDDKKYLEVTGLDDYQIAHLQQIIDDIAGNGELKDDK